MIKTIKLQNFRSYQQEEIHLTAGINVLAGATGVGKTNIIMAIGAAMFGYLPRGKSLVRRGSKSGSVEIDIDGVATIKRVFGSGASWTVYADMGVVAEGVDDVSAWVKNYLFISSPAPLKNIWANALMVAQFGVRDGFELSPTARRQYFDTTMDVDKYQKIWSWLREPLNHIGAKINALELEVARLEPVAERLDDLLASELKVSQRLHDLRNEYTEVDLLFIPECKEAIDKAVLASQIAETAASKVRTHNEGVSRIERSLETTRTTVRRCKNSLKRAREELGWLDHAEEWLNEHPQDFDTDLHDLRNSASALSARKGELLQEKLTLNKQLSLLDDSTCPTCGQSIDDEYGDPLREGLWSNIHEIDISVNSSDAEATMLKDNLFTLTKLRDEALEKRSTIARLGSKALLEDKIAVLEHDFSLDELEIEEIETAGLARVIPSEDTEKALTEARLNLSTQEEKLGNLRSKRAVILSKIDSTRRETDRLSDEVELAEDAENKIASKTVSLGGLEGANDLLAEIRTAIRSAGPEVARRKVALVSRLADQMFGGIWEHRSGELKWLEDYSIQVMLDGVEHGFDVSGGQGVLAAWCIRLALAKVLGQAPLLVLDEATMGSLDDEMVHVIPELIASAKVDQMIVVDHGGIFDAVASNVISIYNNSGVSEVK